MLDAERPQFYAMLTGLFELYGKKASRELFALYYGALKAYDLSDLSRAANQHALDPDAGQFMPKPADFVRHIEGSKQTRSMRAWTTVDRAIRAVGQYVSVTFDDPIIHRVIEDMGGWVDLCQTPTEKDLEFRRHEFDKRYQGYALQGGVNEWQSHLVGLEEADCNRRKLPAPMPRLVGDPEKAKRVLLEGRKEAVRLVHDARTVLGNIVMLEHKERA